MNIVKKYVGKGKRKTTIGMERKGNRQLQNMKKQFNILIS